MVTGKEVLTLYPPAPPPPPREVPPPPPPATTRYSTVLSPSTVKVPGDVNVWTVYPLLDVVSVVPPVAVKFDFTVCQLPAVL